MPFCIPSIRHFLLPTLVVISKLCLSETFYFRHFSLLTIYLFNTLRPPTLSSKFPYDILCPSNGFKKTLVIYSTIARPSIYICQRCHRQLYDLGSCLFQLWGHILQYSMPLRLFLVSVHCLLMTIIIE